METKPKSLSDILLPKALAALFIVVLIYLQIWACTIIWNDVVVRLFHAPHVEMFDMLALSALLYLLLPKHGKQKTVNNIVLGGKN